MASTEVAVGVPCDTLVLVVGLPVLVVAIVEDVDVVSVSVAQIDSNISSMDFWKVVASASSMTV